MNNYELTPFFTQSIDLRVINSPIGKVIPVVDIAKAINYRSDKLTELINRNSELFKDLLYTVTGGSKFQRKFKSGVIDERNQNFQVKALNVHGVVGLLMKLDYNRIQSENKKQLVISFQKWAINTLANALAPAQHQIEDPINALAPVQHQLKKPTNYKDLRKMPLIPPNTPFVKISKLAKEFNSYRQGIIYCISAKTLEAYRYKNFYVIKKTTFEALKAQKEVWFTATEPVLKIQEQPQNELTLKTEAIS